MLAPLLLAACARLPRPATVAEGPYDTQVHVIRRGWHTDIAVPAAGPGRTRGWPCPRPRCYFTVRLKAAARERLPFAISTIASR